MLQKGSSLGKGAPYIQCMVARQQPPKAFVSRCLQGFAAHLGMILGLFSGRGFGSGQRVNGEKRRSDREILPPATNPGGSGGYFMLRGRDYTDFFRTGGLSWLLQEHVTYLHNNIYIYTPQKCISKAFDRCECQGQSLYLPSRNKSSILTCPVAFCP